MQLGLSSPINSKSGRGHRLGNM